MPYDGPHGPHRWPRSPLTLQAGGMAYTLPLIAEAQFASYLSANLTGTYPKATPTGTISGIYSVIKGFSVEPFTAPFVMVSALKFAEEEPFTHCFNGTLELSVTTQIDDCPDPVALHDSTVAQVYGLMSDQAALMSGVNASNFHLWGYYNTSYENGIGEGDKLGRCLATRLEYMIKVQNSGII